MVQISLGRRRTMGFNVLARGRSELGLKNSGECHGKAVAQVAAWLPKRSEQRQVAVRSSNKRVYGR
jgi:hypothetical protein